MENSIGIGDWAAIVTVAGVTIYVLGLIGLAVPIYLVRTRDVATAWYAVSLVPKTVAAGHGFRIWLQWPMLATILILLTTLMSRGGSELIRVRFALSASALVLAALLAFPMRRIMGRISSGGVFLVSLALTLIPGIVGAWIVSGVVIRVTWPFAPAITLTDILVLFAGAFCIGIPPAIAAKPPLPEARITRRITRQGEEEIEGHLVAHSNSFWHLFDEVNELVAIPDEQVIDVRIVPSAEVGAPTETKYTERAPLEDTKAGEEEKAR